MAYALAGASVTPNFGATTPLPLAGAYFTDPPIRVPIYFHTHIYTTQGQTTWLRDRLWRGNSRIYA